jgi:hypothetical protein
MGNVKKKQSSQKSAQRGVAREKADRASPKNELWPFLFINHGRLLADTVPKGAGVYFGFGKPLNEANRSFIKRTCPNLIGEFFSWGETLLSVSSGDFFREELEDYGPPDWDQKLAQFAGDIERWVLGIHAQCPIVFFLGPIGADDDPWGKWSRAKLPSVTIPFLESYAKRHDRALAYAHGEISPDTAFDKDSMCCILQHLPQTTKVSDAKLRASLASLRQCFPLSL